MNLTRMMTDKVFFEDRNGKRIGPFKTKFGADRITVFQEELEVAEGDRVIQPLPDGTERSYLAETVTRNAARRTIPAHVSILLAAGTAAAAATPIEHSTGGTGEHAALLQALTQGIDRADFPADQKDEARRLLQALVAHPVVAAILRDDTRI